MGVAISITYDGSLRCTAVHGPSGSRLITDAPVDNMGKGEAFSPTDLVATALGTCMATTMAIVADRERIDLTGMTVDVVKHMELKPFRRIGRLETRIVVRTKLTSEQRQKLENAAHACPVHKSLAPNVEMPIHFEFTGGTGN